MRLVTHHHLQSSSIGTWMLNNTVTGLLHALGLTCVLQSLLMDILTDEPTHHSDHTLVVSALTDRSNKKLCSFDV